MKKIVIAAVVLGFFSAGAYAWGPTTHVYIYEQLKKLCAIPNMNAVYGAMAPDVFNYIFTSPDIAAYLYDRAHHEFLAVWDARKNQKDRSLAYGFVSHNDTWGMDYTAHHQARWLPGNEGYIVAKAKNMYAIVGPQLTGFGLGTEASLGVCHMLIESAIDIMVKRRTPDLPAKLIAAASHADKDFSDLLYRAYGAGLAELGLDKAAAKVFLDQSDATFRYAVTTLGIALKKKSPLDVAAVAEQLSLAARAVYGIDVDPAVAVQLLNLAMSLCPDYLNELTATVRFVALQLFAHDIIK